MECSRAYSVERHLDQLTIWWNCHATTMDKTSSFARRAIICRVRDSQRRHHARHIPGWWLFAAAKVRVPSVDQIAPRRVFSFKTSEWDSALLVEDFSKFYFRLRSVGLGLVVGSRDGFGLSRALRLQGSGANQCCGQLCRLARHGAFGPRGNNGNGRLTGLDHEVSDLFHNFRLRPRAFKPRQKTQRGDFRHVWHVGSRELRPRKRRAAIADAGPPLYAR